LEETESAPPRKPRKSRKTTKFHKVIRQIHLYTGLFLLPWILVYATSAFVLNHRHAFDKHIKSTHAFEPHSEHSFTPDESFPKEPKPQAREILRFLDLDGPHSVKSKAGDKAITITRQSGGGHYQIRWLRDEEKLVIKRRPFSVVNLLNYLHFTAGYSKNYLRRTAWAATVDFVALCLWIWCISGILMWLRMPRRIPWGIADVVAGWLLFLLLTLLLVL